MTYFINPGKTVFTNGKALQSRTVQASPIANMRSHAINDVRATDFNGDGNLDLVTANLGTTTLSTFIGNGDGTFQTDTLLESDQYNAFLAVDDLEHDGDNDIVVTHWAGNSIAILLKRGDGKFSPRRDYKTALRSYGVADFDANGDGNLDLVTANYAGRSISLLKGVGEGQRIAWSYLRYR